LPKADKTSHEWLFDCGKPGCQHGRVTNSDKVVVVGQGYVGLPLAVRAVEVGFDVVGLDADEARVKLLTSGESFVEDVSDTALRQMLASGRYLPTADADAVSDFSVAVISVPTPLREGAPDLSHVISATSDLARHLRPGATVILESTTYPGTTEELVLPILERESGLVAGDDFYLGYSPERIDPGNRVWTLQTTPKVVAGINGPSLDAVKGFYDKIVDRTVPVSGTREAELTKLLENTFRHVNIALVNELAMFASDLGIDVWGAIDAASSKPFGYMRFTPGPGVGGHCLPIDPSYLSWRVRRRLGYPFRFVELANDVNDHMPDYVVRRLTAAFNRQRRTVNGSSVLVLGMAYKRNTSDARESPSVAVCRRLRELGAEVRVADPHIRPEDLPGDLVQVELSTHAVAAADAVLLLVDHDAFDLNAVLDGARYVLDTRHVLPSQTNVEYL
jgi:UDP-N-acetyl-D-glucosamine dehydrogenase